MNRKLTLLEWALVIVIILVFIGMLNPDKSKASELTQSSFSNSAIDNS